MSDVNGELTDHFYNLALRVLPSEFAGRVLPRLVKQFRESGVTVVGDAPRRLFIGTVNSAGQGYAWARAAERLPGVAAANLEFRGDGDIFSFDADHVVSAAVPAKNVRWRRAERRAIHERFTHVLIESARHPYEPDGAVLDLVDDLHASGIRAALLWHGSDIRIPSEHARREPDSPFRSGQYPDTDVLETITRRNHEIARRAGVPVFVSTPDLLLDLPDARWLPVVIVPERWSEAASDRRPAAGPLTVVHAPSRAGLKGSALIADTVARLHAEGIIDYREVRDVPASRMPTLYGRADVVLDQFSLGIYGVAACEAMAAGCAVVSHVSEQVRSEVRARTGLALPIVESSAAHLDSVLRELASDASRRQRIAEEGVRFVREVHDGRRSAHALEGFLAT